MTGYWRRLPWGDRVALVAVTVPLAIAVVGGVYRVRHVERAIEHTAGDET